MQTLDPMLYILYSRLVKTSLNLRPYSVIGDLLHPFEPYASHPFITSRMQYVHSVEYLLSCLAHRS